MHDGAVAAAATGGAAAADAGGGADEERPKKPARNEDGCFEVAEGSASECCADTACSVVASSTAEESVLKRDGRAGEDAGEDGSCGAAASSALSSRMTMEGSEMARERSFVAG